jgi:glycosyltransferase involved in cell wall biosynthesis
VSLVLLDGRGNARGGTGIARYVRALASYMPHVISGLEFRVLCDASEAEEFSALGAEVAVAGRSGWHRRTAVLPPAAVAHGPGFTAPDCDGARNIVTVQDVAFLHDPDDYPARAAAGLTASLRVAEASAVAVICPSKATEDELLEALPGFRGRTEVIYHGIESEWFDQIPEDHVERTLRRLGVRAPYVLHLGALVPRKDVPTVVRAWLTAKEAVPELSLVLAGPKARRWKSDLRTIRALARHDRQGEGVLVITGYVDDMTARHLVAGATVYATASKCEGFGFTVLEAMASRVPVVASRITATMEVAGQHVLNVEPGEHLSMAEGLIAAVRELPEFGIDAAQDHARTYTWETCAAATADVYARTVERAV